MTSIFLSQLARAPMYYLRSDQMATTSTIDWEAPLPAPDLLLFHDRALPVPDTSLKVLGWLFSGRDGDSHPRQVATAITVPTDQGLAFEIHRVSLTGGAAAPLAAQVLNGVTRSSWRVATRKLAGSPESRPWREKLARSGQRELDEGGLFHVHHLIEPSPN